eukprot:3829791-Prymnesium_polylepis.2
MNDPLFKAGDLMLRASSLVKTDEEFERYNAAMEKWNNKADAGNILAYVSSWGEANPGGGQDEIARYLEKSRKEVRERAKRQRQEARNASWSSPPTCSRRSSTASASKSTREGVHGDTMRSRAACAVGVARSIYSAPRCARLFGARHAWCMQGPFGG